MEEPATKGTIPCGEYLSDTVINYCLARSLTTNLTCSQILGRVQSVCKDLRQAASDLAETSGQLQRLSDANQIQVKQGKSGKRR